MGITCSICGRASSSFPDKDARQGATRRPQVVDDDDGGGTLEMIMKVVIVGVKMRGFSLRDRGGRLCVMSVYSMTLLY